MTQPETAKIDALVEARSATEDAQCENDADSPPMMAVWLSLAAIVLAGLYGLYLGTNAKAQAKAISKTSSLQALPNTTSVAMNDWVRQSS